MKRIPNKTAVRTICYGITGNQHIAIYDYDNEYDSAFERNGKLVCDGKLIDLTNNYRFAKWFDSEYHGMSVEEGTIVFHICTAGEEYK